ncbi:amidohydrolase family protein [Streptomyces mirabilis]|uniref:amidohydrolase family protein n=1 Tax=Streptomyces mirabilis TaxID=68239 RepID=UPI0037F6B3A6
MPLHEPREQVIEYNVVLHGGRVIDPETGQDDVRNVGITAGKIAAVTTEPLTGRTTVDATGLLVCPGFIDLHSHGQAIPEQRLQALDGVTTALELEAGVLGVGRAYQRAAQEGRPIHYGFSTSWAASRMAELIEDIDLSHADAVMAQIGDPAWQRPATAIEICRILERLSRDLADGALGIGILVGYAPLVDPDEYVATARLAAIRGVPTYTHARELIESNPDTPIDGAGEIVRAAHETGAHMHWCHVNSTSRIHVDRALKTLEEAQAAGARVTSEAYPYGAGMTGMGAAFLAPENLERWGLRPSSIIYAVTGERIADARRLDQLRADDPGGLALVEFLDERDPVQRSYLDRAMAFPNTAVASDAVPLTWPGGRPDPHTWPLPTGGVGHPRGAGTFARSWRTMVRESGRWTPLEASRRCSLIPAQVLEQSATSMRNKGRLQVGCDADVAVLDLETISDQATYADSTRPSTGIRHVLVDGDFVVRDGAIVQDALPGQPIRT